MTRLLVSVRSLDEARLAAEAGVDLIDLKEPRHGSLGRVASDVARLVCERFSPARPLSMALGELADWSDADWETVPRIPPGILFAKVGLAGCGRISGWAQIWQRAIDTFPPQCRAVGVVYADWRNADAPSPDAVIEAAAAGCRALLIDTWRKDRGNVFAHCTSSAIRPLFRRAKELGLLTVLAGSLGSDEVEDALSLSPDYLAVRGAVCDGPRDGELNPHKLRQWRELVRRESFSPRLARTGARVTLEDPRRVGRRFGEQESQSPNL
ncbi:MAG TPA: (5-formylfuran-3-yl)methyl phosphate synthase [Pirellulales bacterium]|nr:(5-formylfuran-3-yl)methyl phosphate synthase [Pirellulales bacterium]